MVDRLGAKRTVLYGLATCGASGVLTLLAAFCLHIPWLGLSLLVAGRLLLGASESMTSTGATMWGILNVGSEHTAIVISWNGICTYGALAIGAPLGVYLERITGFWSVGALVILLGFTPIVMALRLPRRPNLAVLAIESACLLGVVAWLLVRTPSQVPDRMSALMWHLIPFQAGWLWVRARGQSVAGTDALRP